VGGQPPAIRYVPSKHVEALGRAVVGRHADANPGDGGSSCDCPLCLVKKQGRDCFPSELRQDVQILDLGAFSARNSAYSGSQTMVT
jgi:hypothetical protein